MCLALVITSCGLPNKDTINHNFFEKDISETNQLIAEDFARLRINQNSNSTKQVSPSMIDKLDQEQIISNLRKLTGEEPLCITEGCRALTTRETGSEDLQWAKTFICIELMNIDYFVEI